MSDLSNPIPPAGSYPPTMKLSSNYPVILTEKIIETADFYCQRLGFRKTFEADWYVSLAFDKNPCFQIALMRPGHESIPVPLTQPTSNLILNFECEDVDDVYREMIVERKLPLLLDLRDEPWGQRHFITRDPSGTLIDIIQPIPASEEFSSQYLDTNIESAISGS